MMDNTLFKAILPINSYNCGYEEDVYCGRVGNKCGLFVFRGLV